MKRLVENLRHRLEDNIKIVLRELEGVRQILPTLETSIGFCEYGNELLFFAK